jgi:hypothetical protein
MPAPQRLCPANRKQLPTRLLRKKAKKAMALGIIPGDPDSTSKAFADVKTELDKEKAAQKAAQIEVDTLTQTINDLKIFADKFAARIPTLEDQVKHLENKVVDGLNEIRAQELYLEGTTLVNNDYKEQNTQLTRKLESKSLGHFENILSFLKHFLTLLRLVELDVEFNTLKAMVDNAVSSSTLASPPLGSELLKCWIACQLGLEKVFSPVF